MDALGTCDLARTEAIRSAALNRNEFVGRLASARGRSSNSDRIWDGLRMLRVVVVDEERSSANAIVRLTSHRARASLAALNRYSGVRVASAQHPDVALLDLDLPLMDGCQVARQLRSNGSSKDCLIVAVTERADDARRKQCSDAGIDLLLIKPVDPEVVETLLLLECLRINRLHVEDAANLATTGSNRLSWDADLALA